MVEEPAEGEREAGGALSAPNVEFLKDNASSSESVAESEPIFISGMLPEIIGD